MPETTHRFNPSVLILTTCIYQLKGTGTTHFAKHFKTRICCLKELKRCISSSVTSQFLDFILVFGPVLQTRRPLLSPSWDVGHISQWQVETAVFWCFHFPKGAFFPPNRVYDQKSTSRSTALRKSYLKSTSVLSYSYLLLNADFFFPVKLISIFNLFIFFLPTREQQKHSQWVSAAELQMGLINKRPTGT